MGNPAPTPYRSASRPAVAPARRNLAAGSVVFIAVLSSVLTTVATNFLIPRYFPSQQPVKAPLSAKAATPAKPGAAPLKVPKTAKVGAPAITMPPVEAATSALNLVQTVREQGSDFSSPDVHPNFWNDLLKVEQAAGAVAKDDGSNPANTAKLAAKFSASLDTAISMAANIAGRTTAKETDDALSQAAQLRDLLTGIRGSLP